MLASISSTSPWNGQQTVGVSSNITVTFGSAMNASTLSVETIKLRDADGNLLPNSLSYNTTNRVLTIDPSSNLVSNALYYSVTVIGGTNGVRGSDNSTLDQTYQFYFTCGRPAFTEETVFSGLTEPTNIEFASNGRIFVAEKSGIIKTFDSLSDTSATVTADLRTQVHNFWDRGLLGMAVDPDFSDGRPYLYVLYTRDADLGGNAPKFGSPNTTSDGGPNATTSGANVSGRLSRLTIGANGVMTGSEQVIIDDWVNQFPSHSIGDLKFGPDGMLYASSGDGASFGAVDYGQLGVNNFNDPPNEGGALRSQDILSSGDPTGLDGTVIRIHPDTGAGVAGSPHASSSDSNNRRIIAWGLRNPFRIAFRPNTSELYIADTGWNNWEEINRIPNVTDNVAENFGWPAYEGMGRQTAYDAANIPLLESLYANPSAHSTPWFTYSHTQQVVSGSGEPTGGSTPTGIAFYQGGSYPAAYDNSMFLADYARKIIYTAFAGPDGNINPNNRVMHQLNRASVELTAGPNGNIYLVDMNNGAIRRFIATGYNNAPTALIHADQTTGSVPLVVSFDGSLSTDPDNDALSFEWDLDGDGQYDDSTSPTPSFTYTDVGDFTVRLRVTDAGGLSSTASVLISAGNTAPVATMISPLTTLNWAVGQTIEFSGSGIDVQDGTLPDSALSWSLVLVHANEVDPTNVHEHPITTFTGSTGSFQAPDHEYPSWIELRLTATDSHGLTSTVTRRIDPRTVVINFASNPTGLQIGFNSEAITAPFSRTMIVGSSNTITAVSPQTSGATTYLFSSWSDGGAATHTYVAPETTATLSATFYAAQLVQLTGAVIGTTGSSTPGNTRDKAFDGSLNTYFDAPTPSGAWTGLDFGSEQTLQQIRFAPRADQPARMVGGKFQLSNTADFSSGVVDLHTVTSVPTSGVFTNVSVNSPIAYRYARYLSPTDGYANVAEIEFYSAVSAAVPAAPNYLVGWYASGGIQLYWNDNSSNESGFRIERRLGAGAWSEIGTVGAGVRSFFDSPVVAATTYSYRVRSYNDSGNSAYSNIADVTTPGTVVTTPAAPSALTANALNSTTVRLAWTDNSTNENQFRIERRLPSGSWALLSAVDANVTTIDDTTVNPNTTYEYRIQAANTAGSSAYSAIVSITTPSVSGTPAAPGALGAVVNANFSVTLNWTDNSSNETSFQLERRYEGWVWDTVFTIPADTTSFTDTTSIGNVKYEYRIRAVNSSGQSAYSNIVPVNTANTGTQPPVAPSNLTGSAQSSSQVTLNWIDNSSDEIGFRVERRLAGATSFAQIGTTNPNVTTYIDTTTGPGQVYEYRVRAAGNGSTFSNYSNTTTVTTPGGTGVPATPSSLIASWQTGPNRVLLSWIDNSDNETAFKIERRYAGWIWQDLATVGPDATSYTDTTAFSGVTYEYRIVALGGGGPSAPSNGAIVLTA